MKKYFYIFLLLFFFSFGFFLSKMSNKTEIFIQFKEIPSDMYLSFSFSKNDSSKVNQIEFGYNDRGIESWLLNIHEKDIKKVHDTYLLKKAVCSQDWITLNYNSLKNKGKLLKQYRVYIIWRLNGEIYILPVDNIKTAFFD